MFGYTDRYCRLESMQTQHLHLTFEYVDILTDNVGLLRETLHLSFNFQQFKQHICIFLDLSV